MTAPCCDRVVWSHYGARDPERQRRAPLTSGSFDSILTRPTIIPRPVRPLTALNLRFTTDRLTAAALAAVAGVAWLITITVSGHMTVGPVMFVTAWTIMMVAMMLPSAAPFVLLHSRGGSARGTMALVGGYLVVWAAAGVPAYI